MKTMKVGQSQVTADAKTAETKPRKTVLICGAELAVRAEGFSALLMSRALGFPSLDVAPDTSLLFTNLLSLNAQNKPPHFQVHFTLYIQLQITSFSSYSNSKP